MLTHIRQRLQPASAWILQPLHFFSLLGALIPAVGLAIFVSYYTTPYPFQDTFVVNAESVLTYAEGRLTPAHFIQRYNGHIVAISRLFSVTNAAITGNWSQAVEIANNYLLAITIVILLIALFARLHPSDTAWVLIPFSALILSVNMGHTYLMALMNTWLYPVVFMLLGMLTIITRPLAWGTVLMAGIWSTLALLSFTTGLAVYPVILLLMFTWGYRRPLHYGLYLMFVVGGVLLFLSVGGTRAEEFRAGSSLGTPLQQLQYVITYLGAVLSVNRLGLAQALGVFGAGLFALNALYLWTQQQRVTVGAWLSLAGYSVGSGVLLAQARSVSIYQAMNERFFMASTIFWIALIALMIAAAHHAYIQRSRWGALLLRVNIIAGAIIATAYFITVFAGFRYLDGGIEAQTVREDLRDCLDAYPLSNNSDCFVYVFTRTNDHLAARRLAGYDQQPQILMLGSLYQPTDRVIIDTDSAWHAVHIRNLLLHDVDHRTILHAHPYTEQPIIERELPRLPDPPPNVITNRTPDTEAVSAWLNGGGAVWVIDARGTRRDQRYRPTYGYERLLDERYTPTVTLEGPYGIQARRFIPPPDLPDDSPIQFGDGVQLTGWQRPADVNVARCQRVPLLTAWEAAADIERSYGITLVLTDANWQGLDFASSPPPQPTYTWEPDTRYLDERGVQIPCDAPAGEYLLLLAVYGNDNPRHTLTAQYPDGTTIGDQVYLTTLFVND